VTGQQHCIGRLEHHLITAQILHSSDPAVGIVHDLKHARMCDNFQAARLERFRNGGHRRRTLGSHVTTASVAETMIEAARSISINFRIDGRRPLERVPAQRASGVAHHVGES